MGVSLLPLNIMDDDSIHGPDYAWKHEAGWHEAKWHEPRNACSTYVN